MPHTRHWSYTLNATVGEWALTPSLGPVGPRECGEPALGFQAMTYVRDTVRHPWLPRNATPGHPGLANIPHCPNQKQIKSQLVHVKLTSQMPLDIQNHVNLHRLLKTEAKRWGLARTSTPTPCHMLRFWNCPTHHCTLAACLFHHKLLAFSIAPAAAMRAKGNQHNHSKICKPHPLQNAVPYPIMPAASAQCDNQC